MIAGGSGITPFLQILGQISQEAEVAPTCSLIYANKTAQDIWLLNRLKQLQKELNSRLKIELLVEEKSPNLDMRVGRVTKGLLEELLRPASSDHLVLHCGPSAMNNHVQKCLQELGHEATNCFQY